MLRKVIEVELVMMVLIMYKESIFIQLKIILDIDMKF
jgi:hypothetical protein